MINIDTYRTILKPTQEVMLKEKGSKFLGYVYPLINEEEVKSIVDNLKSEHHKARHWCYAWQIGTESIQYRVNDDGEPNNSAGQPIYGQILSKELTNVLVVIVRYFGGTKLGVGGLVNAYKTAAQMAIESSKISVKTIDRHFIITFGYPQMNVVMRIIKDLNVQLLEQKMDMECEFRLAIRKGDANKLQQALETSRYIKWKAV